MAYVMFCLSPLTLQQPLLIIRHKIVFLHVDQVLSDLY